MAPLLEVEGILLGRWLVFARSWCGTLEQLRRGVMLGRTRSRVAFEKQFHASLGEATMSDNPFQAPQSDDYAVGVKSGRREDLKSVAVYQKGILICVLVILIAMLSQFLVPLPVVGLLYLFAGLAGTVLIFLLAAKVNHVGLAVLRALVAVVPMLGFVGVMFVFGILPAAAAAPFVPCAGVMVLLFVASRATTVLQQNGHKVGLLGADLSGF